jgi:iron complex outermembrane receptor protein
MSVYAQAAVEPKEDTITVTAAPAPQESAWGPAATIAARQSATGTKTDTPIQKVPQSISVVTAEEMALHQPKSVKEALSYTPGVAVGTRGASNTYDYLIIRGFAADGQSQNNYLNGLKMQGNFYNDAVIDPYMLERAEIMRGPVSVLYGKSSPGGLLNMVSKRPITEPLKEVQFKAGTDSLFQTGFDFSDALDDDGVYSYRLTGLARSANAQQKGSEEQRYAIAPAFTWRPDDKTNFTFLSYFQNEPETGYYGWRKRGPLSRCQTVSVCRQTLTKGRRTTPILVTRRWSATASITNLTIPLLCVRTCALRKIKFRKRAYMATVCVQIRCIPKTRRHSRRVHV